MIVTVAVASLGGVIVTFLASAATAAFLVPVSGTTSADSAVFLRAMFVPFWRVCLSSLEE
jgi:hypothetical protein